MNMDKPEFYDVVIVGSGPSGIATAITAIRAGLKILLVTNVNDPAGTVLKEDFYEPLESLHPGVAVILQQLGVEDVLKVAVKGYYTGISVNGIYSPLSTVPNETWTGFHISRMRFDNYLLDKLKESAVSVRFNAEVNDITLNGASSVSVVLKNNEKINCSYVIDCSGKRRIVGNRLNLKQYLLSPPLVCSTEVIHVEKGDPLSALFSTSKSGWTWLAADENGSYTKTKVDVKKASKQIAEQETKAPYVKLANARWRIFKPLAGPGYILTGDAAGMLDPAAGQGILSALMSGIMAAETAIKSKHDPIMRSWHLAQYHNWFSDFFETKCDALKEEYLKLGIIFSDDMN